MKVFIVFAAVVAVAYANAVGRVGWGAPAAPSIDLELSAAAAAVAAGQAEGGQAILEQIVGSADSPLSPAVLSNINGLDAVGVAQGEDITQVQAASKPDGATSTINAVDVYNEAIATDNLDAAMSGGVSAAVTNNAHTSASGQGSLAAEESSSNLVQSRS